jgi:hypothetical protein
MVRPTPRRRQLLNLAFGCAAAVSLVVCVATVVLWVRSSWITDWGVSNSDERLVDLQRSRSVSVGSGKSLLWTMARWQTWTPARGRHWASASTTSFKERGTNPNGAPGGVTHPTPRFRFGGFGWYVFFDLRGKSSNTNVSESGFELTIPHWFVALLAAILPMWRFGGPLLGRWGAPMLENRCPTCGYDLRATPQRCPECGTTNAENAEIAKEIKQRLL